MSKQSNDPSLPNTLWVNIFGPTNTSLRLFAGFLSHRFTRYLMVFGRFWNSAREGRCFPFLPLYAVQVPDAWSMPAFRPGKVRQEVLVWMDVWWTFPEILVDEWQIYLCLCPIQTLKRYNIMVWSPIQPKYLNKKVFFSLGHLTTYIEKSQSPHRMGRYYSYFWNFKPLYMACGLYKWIFFVFRWPLTNEVVSPYWNTWFWPT